MRLLKLIGIFLLLLAGKSLADRPVLPVATEDYPPYEMSVAVEGLHGFDYEVMKAAFDLMGYDVEVQFLPWKRALHYTEQGDVAGLLTCAHTDEREEFILFSDPISEFTSGLYVRAGYDGIEPQTLEDLAGQRSGSVNGYESLQELQNLGFRPAYAPNTESAIKMLQVKRFDYLYLGRQTTDFEIRRLGLTGQFRFYPIKRAPFHFCFAKKYPGAEQLWDGFNDALKMLRETGAYKQIHDKYR